MVNEILSRREVGLILNDLKADYDWYCPVCFVLLGMGLRSAELIGLTRDSFDYERRELKITKSLRLRNDFNALRVWSSTKNHWHRIVPLTPGVLEDLRQHQCIPSPIV